MKLKEPVHVTKPPKELKPVEVPEKPEIKISISEKAVYYASKTWDFIKGLGNTIGDGFTDFWDVVEVIPKIPETSENVKKASNNIIWIVGGLIILAIVIFVGLKWVL